MTSILFAAALMCLPAQNGPVCKTTKPLLLGSDLDCQMCNVAPQTKSDDGKQLTSYCDALRMISVLSPCDEMRDYDIAKTNRTTM
jgi:hypothetical protein